ncbi:MAG: efflux transporter outer membrane subunit [Betaproteobacteria bacterium]|nr:efflux transporter outer membrane subunit [Betaproteobacteria bacterium]
MNTSIAGSVAVLAALLAAGCASMRGLAPEAAPASANALASQRSLASAKLSPAAWPDPAWWKGFGDPALDRLIDEALADSPTLKLAAARTRKALAYAAVARSAMYPQADAALDATRERFAETRLIPPPVGGSWDTQYQLQATLNWEIDFWGKNRAAWQSAMGVARAAAVDAEAARLMLAVNVAQAYVQLQRAYQQRDIAQATLDRREKVDALTRDRNAAGIDSRLELKQAEEALPAAREQIVQIDETIARTRNQIAALLGRGPDRGLAIGRPVAHVLGAPALPTAVPAELIGRRPDLVAERLRIESAQNQIDVAKAQFYPNVNLAAFAGLQSLGASGFFTAASRMAGVGPAISLPIFDAGRLRGNLAARDADYDAAVEQYNQTLADALRDVVDQLASFRSVEAQREQQVLALATAREAYDLALLRYREGVGNYLQVLSAEQPLLAQQRLDVDLRARELALSINLIRALGGGYRGKSPA